MISIEEVDKIAKLARLEFSASEKQKLTKELSEILNYIDQLKEVEGKTTEALIDDGSLNLMREDAVESRENVDEFLSQAPALEGKYVKVKSVLE